MSALGQKQTFRQVQTMSALPPEADIGTEPRDVRFVPKADIEAAGWICLIVSQEGAQFVEHITNETSAPQILASGSKCRCASGPAARRIGARLSHAASTFARRLCRGRAT